MNTNFLQVAGGHTRFTRRGRPGFTLVELLVVIGIIALLVSILLPVLGRARTSANRVACGAQMRDIGNAFNMYLIEYKNRIPRVSALPSVIPPLATDPTTGRKFMSVFACIDRYTKTGHEVSPTATSGKDWQGGSVWKCRSDRITTVTPGAPVDVDSYFEREGGSYFYQPWFNANAVDPVGGSTINSTWTAALGEIKQRSGGRRTADKVIIFQEFEAWHGKAGQPGAMNFLFADFHVGDITN